MKNGKKHAIFRGLVTVVNDSDMELDICIHHVSDDVDDSLGKSCCNKIVEEIFENEYYHSISGWIGELHGVSDADPTHWSTNDFSGSSNVSIASNGS